MISRKGRLSECYRELQNYAEGQSCCWATTRKIAENVRTESLEETADVLWAGGKLAGANASNRILKQKKRVARGGFVGVEPSMIPAEIWVHVDKISPCEEKNASGKGNCNVV